GTRQHGGGRVDQAAVGVGDDQPHPGQAPAVSDRRNPNQPAPSSDEATSRPRTSRCPSALTPTAISACTLTVRPASRTLMVSASAHTNVYGPASRGLLRNASTCASR